MKDFKKVSLKTLATLDEGQKLLDRYGVRWLKVADDSWLSSELEFLNTKKLFNRGPVFASFIEKF